MKVRYKGALSSHWRWNIILAATLILLTVLVFTRDRKSGIIVLIFSLCYYAAALALYLYFKSRILREFVAFSSRYGNLQEQLLRQIEMPVALVEPNGRVLWMNDKFSALTGRALNYHKAISQLFPELRTDQFPVNAWDKDISISYDKKDFRVHIQRVSINELLDELNSLERIGTETNFLYLLYFADETDLRRLARENEEEKGVVGLVYIDNYEEAMERVDEVHQSLMNVLVDREISRYFSDRGCLARKLEKDKYLIVLNQKSLAELEEDRFQVLEEVKTVNIGNDVGMTISIGIGQGGSGFLQNYEYARSAIEMALGRSGDQAVVKNGDQMSFFGGKVQRGEKNTRVRARVKAQAMREIMLSSDVVLTMGHRITDMDSLGAAIGVYRAAVTLGKQAHIVIGDETAGVQSWVNLLKESKDYEEDLFIDHERAIELTSHSGAAVVVVDTNRPSMVECPEILTRTQMLVVLDHHRQTTEQIKNPSLSYIEPSASSACEMVAEILQYFEEDVRLKNLEADCMYAGIIIDTNNYVAKTGARTFEAAAYLRRSGADVTRVRKSLRDDMASYKARAEAVRHAESYMGAYAISILPAKGLLSPNVIGAQAANELLNIIGVKASFVLTEYDGRVFISARSIDEVNVQVVMERLGGGGHSNIAGAQLSGVTPEEAVVKLKETLKQMTEEGAI